MRTGRGGRKEKNEEQQLNQTVKTTLTKKDLEGIKQQYRQHTVGQRISFAEYIRQRLLATPSSGKGADDRPNLLGVQLELAEIRERLAQIYGETQGPDMANLVKKSGAIVSEDERETVAIQKRMERNLAQIEATIKQVSQWLYDCSPEKI